MTNDSRPPNIVPRTRNRAARHVVVEPEAPPPPPPPPEGFDIGETETFEYRDGSQLGGTIPQRIRILARATGTRAHHAEVMKYLAPLIYKNASDIEIAEAFDISVHSVSRWRSRFKETIRAQFSDRDLRDHWVEAKGRVEFVRGVLYDDIVRTARLGVEGQGLALAMRMRAGIVRAILEVERVSLLIDTGYGRGDAQWLEANRQKAAASRNTDGSPDDRLFAATSDFMAEIEALSTMSLDDLEALVGDDPRMIDVTPVRKG